MALKGYKYNMEFLNKTAKKFHAKMLKHAMQRITPYPIRNLVHNYDILNVQARRMKNEKMLLDYCGLANEYNPPDACYVILAKKLTQTFFYKKNYIILYCNVNGTVTKIMECMPNKIITCPPNAEYAFLMSPNLKDYLNIQIGDKLRT